MTKSSPALVHPNVSPSFDATPSKEIRLYELRHGEAISQAELAGRLDVTQGAISKLEHSEDVGFRRFASTSKRSVHVSNSYAVFDDEDRRVPVHLGKDSAA